MKDTSKKRKWYEKKRYYILVVILIYIVIKLCVIYTETSADDNIPDTTMELMLRLANANEDQT